MFAIWVRIKKDPAIFIKENIAKSGMFLSLGLTGVLPVMISLKQSGFYIVPTYPFFAIAAALFIYPFIDSLIISMNYESKGFIFFKWIVYALFITGIILSFSSTNKFSRDKDKITDTYIILPEIPEGTVININPGMYEDWSLHAYYGRFKNISLDPGPGCKREYLLIRKEYYSDTINLLYNNIKLPTKDYQLFKRK
jgi:hypothetical protein